MAKSVVVTSGPNEIRERCAECVATVVVRRLLAGVRRVCMCALLLSFSFGLGYLNMVMCAECVIGRFRSGYRVNVGRGGSIIIM